MSRFAMAIIGTGMAAAPHARALQELADRVEMRGVLSRDPDRRAAHPICQDWTPAGGKSP